MTFNYKHLIWHCLIPEIDKSPFQTDIDFVINTLTFVPTVGISQSFHAEKKEILKGRMSTDRYDGVRGVNAERYAILALGSHNLRGTQQSINMLINH